MTDSIGARTKQRIAQRVLEFIASAPGPQERVLVGASVISGVSRGWTFLSPNLKLFGRPYYLALTEHHVVFCRLSAWSASKPLEVTMLLPRDQVQLSQYHRGVNIGWFRCQVPGRDKPMTLRFTRLWRPEVEALLAALSTPDPNATPLPHPDPT